MLIPEAIDNVYAGQVQLNYYLYEIFINSTENFDFNAGKQAFIGNYTKELNRYKINGIWIMDELGQVENQIIENNIELNETTLRLNLNFNLAGSGKIDDIEVISVKYNYQRYFEKIIITSELLMNQNIELMVGGIAHNLKLMNLQDQKATLTLSSEPITIVLELNKPQKIDIDRDGKYDIKITLDSIDNEKKTVVVKYETINVKDLISGARGA
jgi:hypothetical protein